MTLISQKESLKTSLSEAFKPFLSTSESAALLGLFAIYDKQIEESVGISEALDDGNYYARKDADWSQIENKVKTYQSLTSASNAIPFDVMDGVNLKTTLNENTTITLSNLVDGDEGNIIIKQGSSNFTVAVSPTPYVINDGGGAVVITDGAGAITILSYTYDGSRLFVTYGPNFTPAT